MNKFMRPRLLRHFAAALLLATLGVRALVPMGYMPGNLLDGKFAELCPVASAATYELLAAQADQQHNHHAGGQDDAEYSMDSACPIGSSLFSDVLPAPDQSVELDLQSGSFEHPLLVSSHSSRQYRFYPARAPPVS